VARIEVDKNDIEKITDAGSKDSIVEKFRELGFDHIAVDLEGYVSGSMNRALGR
jgi:uncharacterized protein